MDKELVILTKWDEKLNQDGKRIVYRNIEMFSDILNHELFFFPEYTDHKMMHINNLLETSLKLIPKTTFEEMTSNDSMVYILSVMYHDLGMHISYDGFVRVIKEDVLHNEYSDLYDDLPWSQLWDEYIKEANLWSDDKRKQVLGNLDGFQELHVLDKTQIGLSLYAQINLYDKLFIGEFIRRYHCRLAFDIAMKGFPTISENLKGLEEEWQEMVGHIARSHGENIWRMLDLLKRVYRDIYRQPDGVHIVYLMVLLRISDYFDISEERAAFNVFGLQHFNSKVSVREWEINQAVKSIQFAATSDPEKVFIQTNAPKNSQMFLSIKRLFKNMQRELDSSWGVLGDTYKNNIALTIRRINSDVDTHRVKYLTEPIAFYINPKVTKLLVGPLYNNNPMYGIRELLQNAIDACKEKEVICNNEEYHGKVTVDLETNEDGSGTISITDNGIGMTKDVIINCYLVAGGSHRDDLAWKNQFIDSGTNVAKVNRIGRYGIGVLATYMLGNDVHVETTSYTEKIKYEFDAILDAEQLDVCKYSTSEKESGTKISIQIPRGIVGQIRHMPYWYCENTPEIIVNSEINVEPVWENTNKKNWKPYTFSTGNKIYYNLSQVDSWAPRRSSEKEVGVYVNGLLVEKVKNYMSINIIENNQEINLSLLRDKLLSIGSRNISGAEVIEELKKALACPYVYACNPFQLKGRWRFCDIGGELEDLLLFGKKGYVLMKNLENQLPTSIIYMGRNSSVMASEKSFQEFLSKIGKIADDTYFTAGSLKEEYSQSGEIPLEIQNSNVKLSLCAFIVPQGYFGVGNSPNKSNISGTIGLGNSSYFYAYEIIGQATMFVRKEWNKDEQNKNEEMCEFEKVWELGKGYPMALYYPSKITNKNKRSKYSINKLIPYDIVERRKEFPDVFQEFSPVIDYLLEDDSI